MSLNAIHRQDSNVIAAIERASARTGVDFAYLYAQAKVESGLNPTARPATVSARGLYQFTAATWLDTVRRHGAEHGIGAATRGEILDLRDDPTASALMAGEFARDNAVKLEAGLGRAATPADLHLAHFLGPAGALRFLRARDADPEAAAGTAAPAAARTNQRVFFERNGSPRSLAAVYDRFAAKFTGKAVPQAGTAVPAAIALAAASTLPRAATYAYLLLAEFGA